MCSVTGKNGVRRTTRGSVFLNNTATTEIYTLSLHDALPISLAAGGVYSAFAVGTVYADSLNVLLVQDNGGGATSASAAASASSPSASAKIGRASCRERV